MSALSSGSVADPSLNTAAGPSRVAGCIEFMLPSDGPSPLPPAVLAHWVEQLSERITSLGGVVQTVQPHVLWFGFGGQEPSLALRRALKVVWPVLQQPAQFQGQYIPIRMALALEEASPTSQEPDVFSYRAQAQAGQCVVSARLVHWLPHGLPTQTLPNGLVALVAPPLPLVPSAPPPPPSVKAPHPQESAPSTVAPQPNTVAAKAVMAQPAPPPPQVLSQPATPPTIPEVVLQRFSAPLPAEPSSTELPVYADMMGQGSRFTIPASASAPLPETNPSSANGGYGLPSDLSPEPVAPVLPVSELSTSWAVPHCFAPLESSSAPTHRYADCPNALLAAIQNGLQAGSPHVVSLTGPSGIGKSVWVNHFLLSQLVPNPQEPNLIWFSSQAAQGAVDSTLPLSMWLDCLQRAIPVPMEGALQSQIGQWIEQSVAQVFRATATPEIRQCLDTLLFATVPPAHSSAMWSEAPTPVLLNTLAQFFSQMATQLPVVVVLDDCHRMDVASLNLLAHLMAHPLLQEARLCWVLTWEDTVQPSGALATVLHTLRHPASGSGSYTPLACGALSSADFQGLIEAGPFQGISHVVSHSVLDAMYDQSQGSLFYVSEAITWLHAQGVFQANEQEQGALMPNPNVDQHRLQLPNTLQSLLLERLRWLTPEQGELLAWCATFGERFSVAGVSYLAAHMGGLSADAIHEAMHGLAAQQWILTDFQQSGQFRHYQLWALLQQSITDWPDRHLAVAQWLSQQAQHSLTTSPALQAVHWQQAGQGLMARPQWLAMASYAHALGSESGTLMAIHQALESLRYEVGNATHLNDAQTAEALQLLQVFGTVLSNNYPDEAARFLPTIVTYAQHRGEVGPWLDALSQCLVTFDQIGHWQGALETLDQLLGSLPSSADELLPSVMQGHRLRCLVALGQFQQAEMLGHDLALQPLQQAATRQPNSPHLRLWHRCLLSQGAVAWRRCQADAVIGLQTLQRHTAGDTELSATALLERIHAQLAIGPYPVCEPWLNDALGLIQSPSDSSPAISSLALNRLQGQWGLAAISYQLAMGQPAKAHPLIISTLQQSQSARDDATWILTNVAAGNIALQQGRLEDAHQVFEAMATHSAERRLAECALASWRGLADVLMAQQRWDEALEIANNALAVAQKPAIGYTLEAYRFTLRQAQCHQKLGQLALAGQTLQALWPVLSATQYMPLMAEGAEAIGQLYQAVSAAQPDAARRQQQAAKGHEFLTLAQTLRQRLLEPPAPV